MTQILPWLLLSGPAALVAAALIPVPAGRSSGRTRADRAFAAALFALSLALAACVGVAAGGPQATGTVGVAGIGLAVTLDSLSAIALLLVSFVGAAVVRFSRNYLDGDPGHARFMRWLALTLAAVLVLIVSGNLAQVLAAWVACSLALHRLLLFYPERPNAVLAARKKFVASRIADACLLAAAILVWQAFGSLDLGAVTAQAKALSGGDIPPAVHLAAAMLVGAAVLKSAQFPLHGWLLEVMETPTPVSALLHAGVINAGGYLLLRWSDLLVLSAPAGSALVVIGGTTALVGSLVMLTQTSIKGSLAWSTIGQMGFMILQCGLGAYASALLHIVAHSLYKAHAFLSSGSAVSAAKDGGHPAAVSPGRLAATIAALFSTGLAVAAVAGTSPVEDPGVYALGAVLLLGVAHLAARAVENRDLPAAAVRIVALGAAVTGAYAVLQWGAAALTADSLPAASALRGWLDLALIATIVAGFAMITLLQAASTADRSSPWWIALHVHVSNGFYVNTLANRWAIRFWPAGAPRPVPSTASRRA